MQQKFLRFVLAAGLISAALSSTVAQATIPIPTPRPDYVVIPPASPADLQTLDLSSVRTALTGIWVQGLDPQKYWTEDDETAYALGSIESRRNEILASYFQALKDVYVGEIDPQTMGSDVKYKSKEFPNSEVLKDLVVSSGGDATLIIQGLASQFPLYQSLEEAMRRLYPASLDGSWPQLPPLRKTLRMGTKDAAVLVLKQRLAQLGYPLSAMDNVYDATTRSAVIDIQTQLKFAPDGYVSPGGKTWAYLATSAQERIRQVQADMEKLRWLNQTPEDRYVFVNTAFTTFSLTDNSGAPTAKNMYFRTINGRPERKTPSMKDKIVYVIFNPFWTIPPTVFIQDKVSVLKNMGYWEIDNYFYQHNFVVVDENDRQMDPTYIDWANIRSANVNFYIKQYPNYMNALGVVKFMLTNPYAIYLHDTDERELFPEANRLRSSGCIRLERPLDFAEYLLQGTSWTREKIDNFVVKPGEVLSQETRVNLNESLPVYILPVTSQVSSDGVLRFTDDVYGHNRLMIPQLPEIGK